MHEEQFLELVKETKFLFSTSTFGFYFQAHVQSFAFDSYRTVGKNSQVNMDITLLKTVYKKTPKLYIN